jgi:hypothetical protein
MRDDEAEEAEEGKKAKGRSQERSVAEKEEG